jgi:oxygen-dependent protoporphyrinogen oxidase
MNRRVGLAKVAVIGGGISGLACAREILDRLPGEDLVLLESSGQLGGHIASVRDAGWVLESGPNAFLNKHPSTLQLVSRLGLDSELVTANEAVRRRYIYKDGRLRRFPDSMSSFLLSDLLSFRSRTRVLAEPLIPPVSGRREESVAEFARRRLGREAANSLLDPVVAGIYAGDPERLSAEAALPQLVGAERAGKSLLEALLRSREKSPSQGHGVSPSGVGMRRMVSFRRGMGCLIEALEQSLSQQIRRNSPVQSVSREGSKWRVEVGGDVPESMLVDVVVSAMPAPAAKIALGGLSFNLKQSLGGVPTAPVSVVALGYREMDVPHPMNGFGYLVPSSEKSNVLGVMWSSSMFPGVRAPAGHVLFRVFLGGMRDTHVCERDDADLFLRAREHLQWSMGIHAKPTVLTLVRHWVGIPQYELGHKRRLEQAEKALFDLPGLFLAGNAFHGVGVNPCTARAELVADQAISYLKALGDRPGERLAADPATLPI